LRVERALGLEGGSIKGALEASSDEGGTTILEAERLSSCVYLFARNFTKASRWEGSVTDLYNTLTEREKEKNGGRLPRDWPANPKVLSEKLALMQTSLRSVGVVWERVSNSNKKGRKYCLYYEEPERTPPRGDADDKEGDADGEDVRPPESGIDKGNAGRGTQGTQHFLIVQRSERD